MRQRRGRGVHLRVHTFRGGGSYFCSYFLGSGGRSCQHACPRRREGTTKVGLRESAGASAARGGGIVSQPTGGGAAEKALRCVFWGFWRVC